MSSFIKFSGHVSASVWNSSFKAILDELEEASTDSQLAAKILEENPIARPIGGLNLSMLTAYEILEFIRFMTSLRHNVMTITDGWSTPNNINQLPIDLVTIIKEAEQVAASDR